MADTQPRWGNPSLKRREFQVNRFGTILASVAKGFAYHADADYVSVSHVDEAFRALSRCQLVRTPWYRTPEFITSVGALLIGTSFSLVTLLGRTLPQNSSMSTSIQIAVWAALFVVGCLVWIGGWRSRPTMPHAPVRLSRLRCMWPFGPCPHVDDIAGGKHT